MRHATTAILLILTFAISAFAQQRPEKTQQRPEKNRAQGSRVYPPNLPGAQVEIYKTIGDVELTIHIFNPPDHRATDTRPAVVFFFGGGWRSGSPGQFLNQCRYLASRGMVAMTADYRVLSRHGTPAVKCVADAKSAVRWVRANAERLGIDPDRIAAGGGSAGGHLAACTGTVPGFDEPGEATDVCSKPNAMLLFNPAVVLANIEGEAPFDAQRTAELHKRIGADPAAISPYHQIQKGAPPTIIFHGTGDTTVPFRTVEQFTKKMTQAGNSCKLVPSEGKPHGFFNHGRFDNEPFTETMRATDRFLVKLGYLEGEPTIDRFE